MIGTSLSHYDITAELGRGGMGIVYKARDTKLDREVALKVLPAAALASEDDRARFYREAKAAAALNHPHIAQIYQIDEAVPTGAPTDDVRPFIAMEFIDGETLDARIKKGPLKLEDALRIASEATDALKMAHEKNIVHRDVKSANIMLDANGRAKVLDFGLAQTSASTKLTRMGSTLGTVAYMSPEQARGEEVDHRTDIWALGVILYEMVAGRHPFAGDYEQAVVYSILNEGVEPLTGLRAGVPMSLEWIVSKCLAKDAKDRYQSAGDLLVDLRNVDLSDVSVLRSTGSRTQVRPGLANEAPRTGTSWPMALAGVLIGVMVTGIAWWGLGEQESSSALPVYSHITFPDGITLEPGKSGPLNLDRTAFALSPDGSMLVVVASFGETTALYKRPLREDRFERIPGTEGAYGVTFSPDGSRVAFYADNLLKTVAVNGGAPRELIPVSLPYDLAWTPTGHIVFLNDEGGSLVRVSENGDDARVLQVTIEGTDGEPLLDYLAPVSVLPDGDVLSVGFFGTYALNPLAETAREISEVPIEAIALPTGQVILPDGAGLTLNQWDDHPFDLTGPGVQLVDSLYHRMGGSQINFAASKTGTVAFLKGPDLARTHMTWLDNGELEEIPVIGKQDFGAFRISPDGRSVAAPVFGLDGQDLWIFDLTRGTRASLTAGGVHNYPAWSPDGSHVYWGAWDEKEWIVLRSPVGGAARLDTVYRNNSSPEWISPDGRFLGVIQRTADNRADIGMVDMENGFEYISIAQRGDASEVLSRLSNSGDYVAYTSNQTGDYEVFVQPIPPTGREWQVSLNGGEEPLWSNDDRTIYWRNGDRLLKTSVTYGDNGPSFSEPEVIHSDSFENVGGYSIDISPVDERILLLISDPVPTLNRIDLITNFPALLENE